MKKQKGITLIALVITIIVLLILAGVSIVSITGENGMLENARNVKEKTDIASDREKINLALSEYKTYQTSTLSKEEFLRGKTDLFSEVNIYNNVITVKMKECGHTYNINEDNVIVEEKAEDKELADDTINEELKSMITTWRVEAGQTIELPVLKMGQEYDGEVTDIFYEYNITVDWGDGTPLETFSSEDDNVQVSFLENYNNKEPEIMNVIWAPNYEYAGAHTYNTSGTYQIKITGSFDAWMDENWDNPELLSIDQWGVTNTKQYAIYLVRESIASPSKNTFKNSLLSIGSENSITIPENAFSGVEELYISYLNVDEITIPASVQYVSIVNSNLNNIYVEKDNAYYTSVDGVLYSKDKKSLIKFPDARTGEFEVPNFVEIIESNSFDESQLTSVKISDSVIKIKNAAFDDNDNLQSIYVPSSVTIVEDYAMYLYNVTKVYCEASSKPSGWSNSWNIRHSSNIEIIWGYTGN